MELKEFKQAILEDKLSEDFVILKYKDNTFIVDQYINEICSRRGCDENKINSLFEINQSALSLVFDFNSDLNVLRTENFDEIITDYDSLKNTIVVCKSVDTKILSAVEQYIIEIPAVVDWQVEDYMKAICSGLTDDTYKWLYAVTGGDVYKITNELDKLRLFDEDQRGIILSQLIYSENSDLYKLTFDNLMSSIVNRQTDLLFEYLKHQELLDFDPIRLTNALLNRYKNLMYVRFETGKTTEELGISNGYRYHLKTENISYSLEALEKIIKFLSGIDIRLKNNEFDIPRNMFINYLICKLYSLGI